MKALTTLTLVGALALSAIAGAAANQSTPSKEKTKEKKTMELGNFSISLSVKDMKASKEFYEKLDFKEVGGKIEQNWLILQNGTTTVGLFHGIFEGNIMTFNPGWNSDKETLKDFQDVRELQKVLRERGVKFTSEADESTDGPANFILADPDGNTIYFDQHVPRPKRK